jgi:hypothetical protein
VGTVVPLVVPHATRRRAVPNATVEASRFRRIGIETLLFPACPTGKKLAAGTYTLPP